MPARPAGQPDPEAFAARLESSLVARIGAERFHMWFGKANVRFVPSGAGVAVATSTAHFQDWLESTFGDAIRLTAREVLGEAARVRFVTDPDLFRAEAIEPPRDITDVAEVKGKTKSAVKTHDVVKSHRRWKTLSDFVVGPSNRVAHAAALSVVEDPAEYGNPLVLHGSVGTGKTHLLEGIYHGLRKRHPDLRPTYISAEEFTTRFVQASRFEKHTAFRRQFRECSALLLDDLHFFATKPGTQREFIHTLDALVADGRLVAVTTDCHPRLAEELMPELVDRLLGGAVWPLQSPDEETRLEILRKKSGGSPPIPDAVLRYLARVLKNNVRELEGAIHGIRHYAKLTGKPVDASLVSEAIGDLLRHTVRVVTIKDVDEAVCSVLRLASGSLQSKARNWAVSHPRMIAIYLCRKHTAATFGEIAKHFKAKTHSAAVAAEKKVRGWIAKGEKLAIGERSWNAEDIIDRIERELQR